MRSSQDFALCWVFNFVEDYCWYSSTTFIHLRKRSLLFVLKYHFDWLRRGALGFSVLRFWILFWSVLRFLCQKTSVFRFWCSMRFADFSFFSIWFSVFVKNISGFSVLVPKCGFWFFLFFSYLALFVYTVLYSVFGFGRFCLRFCGFEWIFLRFCGF